ncbi:MAG: type VI secretion system baseplate subunit TssF [Gammaproteobacteria bacterium]|nr:type VI secretion system baseplate subunit TssF [Gammaproteobacteria bacterium]MDH5802710.1 type VI secretion system baseplate subunit TssF [Gammaproteobacteria bacterium]
MDPRLLQYYNRELQHIREMGGEFAKEYPKIAGRLGLETFECADPYVERLLEGFAFLAARVQLKVDSEFPQFTQHMLEMIYPQYLSPTPSMAVVQFNPDLNESGLAEGFEIPRNSVLRSLLGKGEQTVCEYRTSSDIALWPLEITNAEYLTNASSFVSLDQKRLKDAKAGVKLRLRATAGLTINKLALEKLPLYLRGSDELPMHLYEQILANSVAIVARPAKNPGSWCEIIDKRYITRTGFEDNEAVLPQSNRSFQGYRLLHEYFTFPQRFMFIELGGLGKAVKRCEEKDLELVILFDRIDRSLEELVNAGNFSLHCTPAINLFPKRADRIHLNNRDPEFHIVPDRTRPLDFEIYSVTEAIGIGTSADDEQEFLPFYAATDLTIHRDDQAYYTLKRVPRMLSSKQVRKGPRSSYIGSETFISLVDGNNAPYRKNLRQLAVQTMCTNRDLPLHMALGTGKTDFTMESSAPVESVRCIAGPSKPKASHAEKATAWRLISHLSLNYLSIADTDDKQGAASMRELLALYGDLAESHIKKQIDGVISVTAKPVTRRVPVPGPITFGRGMEVTITFDESAFEGLGVFSLGAVMEEFFAKYVSINSFTETVIRTAERGEIMRWPVRAGLRHIL